MGNIAFGAASVVAVRGNQFLGVPKGKQFQLPGGKRQCGESPVETAIREIREETGLVISPDALRPLCETRYLKKGHGVMRHVFFACDLSTDPSNHERLAWLTETEAKNKKLGFLFVYQKAVRRYLRNRHAVAG